MSNYYVLKLKYIRTWSGLLARYNKLHISYSFVIEISPVISSERSGERRISRLCGYTAFIINKLLVKKYWLSSNFQMNWTVSWNIERRRYSGFWHVFRMQRNCYWIVILVQVASVLSQQQCLFYCYGLRSFYILVHVLEFPKMGRC